MIAAPFEYQRATSVEDALAKLAATDGAGKFIAGGHSLVPMMKLRMAQPSVLIDIGRLAELQGIAERDGALEIGACTTHADIAASPLVQQLAPALADAAGGIGDPQVRHRGTIGGSVAHADPASDYPAVLVALDADVVVRGTGGTRRVKADAFFQDLFTVDLQAGEIVAAVSLPPQPISAYAKLHQKASHYAIVGVAASLDVRDGTMRSAGLGVTGAGSHAVRLPRVEQALTGKPVTAEQVATATADAAAGLSSVYGDLHASAEYRRAMVGVFARRAIERALSRQPQK